MKRMQINSFELSFSLVGEKNINEDKSKVYSVLDYANFTLNKIAVAPDELVVALIDYGKEIVFDITCSGYPIQKSLEPKLIELIPLLQKKMQEEKIDLDLTQEPQLNAFVLYKKPVVLPSLKSNKGPKLGR